MIEATQIESMPTSEQLRVMEQLWDALCRVSPDVSSPDWHRDVLLDRKARAERGESKFLTMDQLQARLRTSGS